MKCLKCKNPALSGKALCAECFADHEAHMRAMESKDWVDDTLKSTRQHARERDAEALAGD